MQILNKLTRYTDGGEIIAKNIFTNSCVQTQVIIRKKSKLYNIT